MLLERGLVAMMSKNGARGSYSSITLTNQVRVLRLGWEEQNQVWGYLLLLRCIYECNSRMPSADRTVTA